MPDSLLPPAWGPASFDDRDLDAVLSGETADIPLALRPVADTLAALRAAPAPAELSGEAGILAEFRALTEPRVPGASAPGASAPGTSAPGTSRAPQGDGLAHTLRLPVPPHAPGSRHGARHRGRRQAFRPAGRRAANRRPGSRRTRLLMGTAIAAVAVVAIVFGVILPGPIQNLAHFGHPSAASASAPRSGGPGSGSPGLQAKSASPEPTATPSTARLEPPQQSEQSKLCRTYYGYFTHQEPQASWAAEMSLFAKLSKRAGGPLRVLDYCAPYLGDLFPHGLPGADSRFPGFRSGGSGDFGVGSQGQSGQGQSGSGSGSIQQNQMMGPPHP